MKEYVMLLSRLGPVTYRYIPGGTDVFCFLPGKAASLQCRTGHSNLIWPLALFFPMCAALLLLPNLADPSQSYALLVNKLLPSGVVGLVITGLFAHTMAMTSSDANAVSAVAVRDMLPALRGDGSGPSDKIQLLIGISCTFCFLELSMLIALMADRFGGVIGLIVLWYGALAGPIAVPILLGLLRGFRRSGPAAAIGSWVGGAVAFGPVKVGFAANVTWMPGDFTADLTVGGPVLSSLALYLGISLVWPSADVRSNALLELINGNARAQELMPPGPRRGNREPYD
jgi:SSS family solute:Na+ symporter